MNEIELTATEWARLKRKLMSKGAEALRDYTPPVKLTHGGQYVIHEKGNDDGTDTDN